MRKFIIWIFSVVILMSGCAAVKEAAKGIAGVSTRSLEQARKKAITKTFNYDYFSCYAKVLDILKEIKAYVYAQNIKNHMIAIYVSEEDTTPVGLFFTETTSSLTQIEVSSPSTYAKEFIAKELFSALEGIQEGTVPIK